MLLLFVVTHSFDAYCLNMKRISIKIGCVIFAIITLVCPSVHFAQDNHNFSSQDYSNVNSDSASVAIGGFFGVLLNKEMSFSDFVTEDGSPINRDEVLKGFEDGLTKCSDGSYKAGLQAGMHLHTIILWLEQKGLKIDKIKLLESFRYNSMEGSEEKANEYISYIKSQMPFFLGSTTDEVVDSMYFEADSVAWDYYEADSVVVEDYLEDSVAVVEYN